MNRKEKFERVRSQVLLVRRLGEQMRELAPDGLRSLRLDGTPGTAVKSARGLDVQLERRENMERMLRRESALLKTYEREARREMDGMKPELYAFCAMYYLAGMTMDETARAIDRCARQCMRYKAEIGRT